MAKDKIVQIEKIARELLDKMGLTYDLDISVKDDVFTIEIKTEEAGLIIGKRGETLDSLQSIIAMAVYTKLKEWVHIVTNVGDWRQRREEYVKSIVTRVAEKVKETKQSQPIYNLNPTQRRIAHLLLKDDEEVVTESEGEGDQRYLVIKPKN